jgi:hypothetical protein
MQVSQNTLMAPLTPVTNISQMLLTINARKRIKNRVPIADVYGPRNDTSYMSICQVDRANIVRVGTVDNS